jgi:hypothetical protein
MYRHSLLRAQAKSGLLNRDNPKAADRKRVLRNCNE